MSFASHLPNRKLFGLSIFGAMVGAVFAFTAPPTPLVAAHPCTCNDGGTGSKKCSGDQTACIPGSEWCVVVCIE